MIDPFFSTRIRIVHPFFTIRIDPFFTISISIVNSELNFSNIHLQLLMETKDMNNCNDDKESSSIICSASVSTARSIYSVAITSNQIHVNRPTKVVVLRDIGRQYFRIFSTVSILICTTQVTLST